MLTTKNIKRETGQNRTAKSVNNKSSLSEINYKYFRMLETGKREKINTVENNSWNQALL